MQAANYLNCTFQVNLDEEWIQDDRSQTWHNIKQPFLVTPVPSVPAKLSNYVKVVNCPPKET